jgi:hypothetical protein
MQLYICFLNYCFNTVDFSLGSHYHFLLYLTDNLHAREFVKLTNTSLFKLQT